MDKHRFDCHHRVTMQKKGGRMPISSTVRAGTTSIDANYSEHKNVSRPPYGSINNTTRMAF